MVQYTREEIIEEINRLYDLFGRVPSTSEINEEGKMTAPTLRYRFGSLEEAFEAAGIEDGTRGQSRVPTESLISDLESVADELGRSFTKNEYDEHGTYSSGTVQRRFDSWNTALEEIGLEPNIRFDVDEDELLSEIERLADEIGRTPTSEEMREDGKFSRIIYEERFGSWNEALERTDLDLNLCRWEDERVLTTLEELAEDLGHPPRGEDINEHTPFTESLVWARFGSLRNALQKIDMDIYKKSGEDHHLWKGGGEDYYGSNWPLQRQRAILRDQYRCQVCGVSQWRYYQDYDVGLHIHHIKPIREFDEPEEANTLDNLVTLCASCHKDYEGEKPNLDSSTWSNEVTAD